MKKFSIITALIIMAGWLSAQSFVDIGAGLTGVHNSFFSWCDYDGDGDQDILVCGELDNGTPVTKLYNNYNGDFIEVIAGFEGVTKGAAVWADYDCDGDADVLITGYNAQNKTFLYRNDGGVFVAVENGFAYFGEYSYASWGDYDNDGDADICITGGWNTVVYINESDHTFTPLEFDFPALNGSRTDWGDYDADGDLDLLLTGDTGGGMKAYIFKNNNGSFEEIQPNITGLSSGAAKWGDYDSDGDLDILITGFNDYIEQQSFIYRNDGDNIFQNIYAGLPPVALGSAAWGDYDNDGDLDVAITGKLAGCGSFTSSIYKNEGNDFFNQDNTVILTAAERSFVAWGDFDNDHDLDLALSGLNSGGSGFVTIYRNDGALPNFAPETPQDLSVAFTGSEVIFSWSKANDNLTPQDGLTYNMCIGSQSGVYDVMPPLTGDNGYGLIPAFGNVSLANSVKISGLTEGETYFWTVQTVDNTFERSAFAPEQSFTVIYTGTASQNVNEDFVLSPNPATDKFSISMSGNISDIAIFNVNGVKVYDKKVEDSNLVNIDCSGWNKGIYLVLLSGDNCKYSSVLTVR